MGCYLSALIYLRLIDDIDPTWGRSAWASTAAWPSKSVRSIPFSSAIDGKRLSGSYDIDTEASHVLSAWAAKSGLSLA